MKKLLVLMLVVGMASLASAGMMLKGPAEVVEGDAFQIIVSGLAADATGMGVGGGVYSTPGAGGQAGVAEALVGAGNLGSVLAYSDGFFDGWDFTAGALVPQVAEDNVVDGDWIVLSYIAGAADTTETFGLYDYAVSFDDPIQTITVAYAPVPEPISLALLGLGGLFLRRRK